MTTLKAPVDRGDLCSVTDETGSCPKSVIARGMCKGHWQRWSRDGEPGPVQFRRIRKGSDAVCSVADCGKRHEAHGYCQTHYYLWRSGDVARPVQEHAARIRLNDQEMGLIADLSMPAKQVADQLGLHPVTINKRRRDMDLGVFRTSDWTDPETDFLIESMSKMKTERMAHYLQRSLQSVQTEIKRLRSNGAVAKRNKNLDPWIISGRPLLAKTCPDCGRLLDAKCFRMNAKRKKYPTTCAECRTGYKRKPERVEKFRSLAQEYQAKCQALTLETAENRGKEWTSSEIEVLADPSKTTLEKALELKRTYAGTANALVKNDLTSKPVRIGDHNMQTWQLFWEFEDQAVTL